MSGLLRPSEAATLAIHACGLLASAQDGRAMTTEEMAAAIGASEAHLSKVMQRLARAGIIVGRRGPGGGFRLAAAPSSVTLLSVYEAVDGPLPRRGCLLGVPRCPGDSCPLRSLMAATGRSLVEGLSRVTVADLGRAFEHRGGRGAARTVAADQRRKRKKGTSVRQARR
jgi:Rrf2 family protein